MIVNLFKTVVAFWTDLKREFRYLAELKRSNSNASVPDVPDFVPFMSLATSDVSAKEVLAVRLTHQPDGEAHLMYQRVENGHIRPRLRVDALGEYAPEIWWKDEQTPLFESVATEWMFKGRDLPEPVGRLVRVPAGAMDVLARAAERGCRAGRDRYPEQRSSSRTPKPRQRDARRSGNPAKRAAAT